MTKFSFEKITLEIYSNKIYDFYFLYHFIRENKENGNKIPVELFEMFFSYIRPFEDIDKEELNKYMDKVIELEGRFQNRHYLFNGKPEVINGEKIPLDLSGLCMEVICVAEKLIKEKGITKEKFAPAIFEAITVYVTKAGKQKFIFNFKRWAITAFVCIQYGFLPVKDKNLSNEKLFQRLRTFH